MNSKAFRMRKNKIRTQRHIPTMPFVPRPPGRKRKIHIGVKTQRYDRIRIDTVKNKPYEEPS